MKQATHLTLFLGLLSITLHASAQTTHVFTIGTWSNAGGGGGSSSTFNQSHANDMVAQANSIIQGDSDGSGTLDAACSHQMLQWGGLQVVYGSMSDGNINSASEYAYIDHAAVYAKIVPSLSWCGAIAAGIGGCANTNAKNSIVLADWAAEGSRHGITLAHEYGHSVGMTHVVNAQNIMNPWVDSAGGNLYSGQCPFYLNVSIAYSGPGTFDPSQTTSAQAMHNADVGSLSIQNLAHTIFIDSVPVEVSDFYNAGDLVTLKGMLADPAEHEHFHTIVALVGLLSTGSDADAQSLIDFVGSHQNDTASISAMVSLGYVAERGSKAAMEALKGAVTQPASSLSKAAVSGLALAGGDEAYSLIRAVKPTAVATAKAAKDTDAALVASSLTEIKGHAPNGTGGPVMSAAMLEEAANANRTVASKGRRGYYNR